MSLLAFYPGPLFLSSPSLCAFIPDPLPVILHQGALLVFALFVTKFCKLLLQSLNISKVRYRSGQGLMAILSRYTVHVSQPKHICHYRVFLVLVVQLSMLSAQKYTFHQLVILEL
jgi:hypothetical protein